MLNKRSSVHRKIVRYDWPNERTAKKQLHYLCLRHGLCVIMRWIKFSQFSWAVDNVSLLLTSKLIRLML